MNSVLYKKRSVRILWFHIAFWLATYLIVVLTNTYYYQQIVSSALLFITINHVFQIAIVYFHLLFLLPRYLEKKKTVQYLIILLLTIPVFILAKMGLKALIGFELSGWYHEVLQFLITAFVYGAFLTAVKFFNKEMQNKDLELQLEEAEKEKLSAELKYLKAQIEPHFLFNTLNNIYTLSINKSEKTPDYILMLSELMSYVIYDSASEFVHLEKELKFIKHYIALEKIRLDDGNSVNYSIEGVTKGCYIAPLLLISIVENAFKHGVKETDLSFSMNIRIRDSSQGKEFTIVCENAIGDSIDTHKDGIGLENLRARLDMIYPDNYRLLINSERKMFKVELSIILDKTTKL